MKKIEEAWSKSLFRSYNCFFLWIDEILAQPPRQGILPSVGGKRYEILFSIIQKVYKHFIELAVGTQSRFRFVRFTPLNLLFQLSLSRKSWTNWCRNRKWYFLIFCIISLLKVCKAGSCFLNNSSILISVWHPQSLLPWLFSACCWKIICWRGWFLFSL